MFLIWLTLCYIFQIDGVEALNNVLLIGMTNRKDMLDEALLRSFNLYSDFVYIYMNFGFEFSRQSCF